MHPPKTRTLSATALAAALACAALTGCSNNSPQPTDSGTTAASVATTDARAEALRKSEEAVKKWNQLDPNDPVSGDFIDPKLIEETNKTRANWQAEGITVKAKTFEVKSVKGVDYRTNPLGTTVLACVRSNYRLIDKNGNDITRDQRNQPMPDQPTDRANHFLLDSKDGGVTWQITGTSPADLSACSAS